MKNKITAFGKCTSLTSICRAKDRMPLEGKQEQEKKQLLAQAEGADLCAASLPTILLSAFTQLPAFRSKENDVISLCSDLRLCHSNCRRRTNIVLVF